MHRFQNVYTRTTTLKDNKLRICMRFIDTTTARRLLSYYNVPDADRPEVTVFAHFLYNARLLYYIDERIWKLKGTTSFRPKPRVTNDIIEEWDQLWNAHAK